MSRPFRVSGLIAQTIMPFVTARATQALRCGSRMAASFVETRARSSPYAGTEVVNVRWRVRNLNSRLARRVTSSALRL